LLSGVGGKNDCPQAVPLRGRRRNAVSFSDGPEKDEARIRTHVRRSSPRFKRLVVLVTPFLPSELLITSDMASN
jgi:hypothetical protein